MKYKIFIIFTLLLQQPFLSYANEQVDTQEEFLQKNDIINNICNIIENNPIKTIFSVYMLFNLYLLYLDNTHTFDKNCNYVVPGSTSLGLAAKWTIKNNHISFLNFLLHKCKVNPNFRDASLCNLLEKAIKCKNVEATETLIGAGAEIMLAITPISEIEENIIQKNPFTQFLFEIDFNPENYVPLIGIRILLTSWFTIPYNVAAFFGRRQINHPKSAYEGSYLKDTYIFLYENNFFDENLAQEIKNSPDENCVQDSIQYIPNIILETHNINKQIEKLEENNLNDTQRKILNILFYDENLDLQNFNLEKYKNQKNYIYHNADKNTFSKIYTAITMKQKGLK